MSNESQSLRLPDLVEVPENNENDSSAEDGPEDVAAAPPANPAKDWQRLILPGLRQHLITKIARFICADPQQRMYLAVGLQGVMAEAERINQEAFDAANDRDEYYCMLAESIFAIQKEIGTRTGLRF